MVGRRRLGEAGIVLGLLLGVHGWTMANEVLPGSGLSQVKSNSTGIYELAVLSPTKRHQALALFRNGQFVEIHARKKTGGRYLARQSGAPIKVSTSNFNQLIGIAGINRDVSQLPPPRDSNSTLCWGTRGAGAAPCHWRCNPAPARSALPAMS